VRSILLLFLLSAACGSVLAAEVPELLPELRYAAPDSWIGQSREEIVAKWGEPFKAKPQKDGGERIVFERKVMLGAVYSESASIDIDLRKEKSEEGKSRLVAEQVADGPVDLVFKKMKFKFWFGADGRVERVDFPDKLTEDPAGRTYAAPPPRSDGASPYSP
jgi:hypothetical protein